MMEPHIDVITLAVGDLDRSLGFYRDGLGLETTPATSATPTDTSGRSSGTRRPKTPRSDHRQHALAITGQRGLQMRVSSEFRTSGHAPTR
jgi:catechol 2,3-dioxygenase-like lactoylglutathione lyase family enzyme